MGWGVFRVEITLNNLGSSFGFRCVSKERGALGFGISKWVFVGVGLRFSLRCAFYSAYRSLPSRADAVCPIWCLIYNNVGGRGSLSWKFFAEYWCPLAAALARCSFPIMVACRRSSGGQCASNYWSVLGRLLVWSQTTIVGCWSA